ARRRDYDQRLGLAGIDLRIEMTQQLVEEFLLLLLVKIGLLHSTAPVSDRAEAAPRRAGPELARLRIGMLEDLARLQVQEFLVAGVLQHQRLLAVAHHDPVTVPDLQLAHESCLLGSIRGA